MVINPGQYDYTDATSGATLTYTTSYSLSVIPVYDTVIPGLAIGGVLTNLTMDGPATITVDGRAEIGQLTINTDAAPPRPTRTG